MPKNLIIDEKYISSILNQLHCLKENLGSSFNHPTDLESRILTIQSLEMMIRLLCWASNSVITLSHCLMWCPAKRQKKVDECLLTPVMVWLTKTRKWRKWGRGKVSPPGSNSVRMSGLSCETKPKSLLTWFTLRWYFENLNNDETEHRTSPSLIVGQTNF